MTVNRPIHIVRTSSPKVRIQSKIIRAADCSVARDEIKRGMTYLMCMSMHSSGSNYQTGVRIDIDCKGYETHTFQTIGREALDLRAVEM